jgi:hypothetical protein
LEKVTNKSVTTDSEYNKQSKNMEIKGKVIDLLNEQRGDGQRAWRKRDFVIETQEQYPKKVCISLWGDKIDSANLKIGEEITVSINIESREFKGKWYTNVKAWKIDKGSESNAPTSGGGEFPPPQPMDIVEDDNEPLPF